MSRATKPEKHLLSVDEEQAPSASEVVHALIGVSHVIGRIFDARLASLKLPLHLSGPRLRIFLAVEHAGRMRMGDLAAALSITPRTVTTLVDALEKDGLLVRLPDPTDRRATLLELTPTARAHAEQVHAVQHDLSEEVVASLDATQRRQFLDLLLRLQDDLCKSGNKDLASE